MLSRIKRWIRSYALRGNNVQCCICEKKFISFLPAGDEMRAHTRCPGCYSNDRNRQLWLLLRPVIEQAGRQLNILHIAPERSLSERLLKIKNIALHAIDKFEKGYSYPAYVRHGDITALSFPDNLFDIIICSHVLEHVPEDQKAMKELYRVMKPGGTGYIMVPFFPELKLSLEDETITTPEERKALFGQADHVRKYGLDLETRLRDAGFAVTALNQKKNYSNEEQVRMGLLHAEPVFIVTKS